MGPLVGEEYKEGSMEETTLVDGRKVRAEPCLDIEFALIGSIFTPRPQVYTAEGQRYVECRCCDGSGGHTWSPSGYGVDPNSGHYSCSPCAGTGHFRIQTP